MGLFDAIREKAAELLGGAEEKVSELTGTEVPNTDALAEEAQGVGESAQGYVDGATETATGAAQDVTNALPEVPNPDTFDPRSH
ncbi:hypothetical protein [Actinophytocola sp.]|uniref:hypothetical protein n=1 Tax=Actinophytocola sp. TaxID=1872138 RepID=UPI002ED05310